MKQKPIRIQRQRFKNWRLPGKTVYVGGGSGFGNPFVAGVHGDEKEVVETYREYVGKLMHAHGEQGEYFRQKVGKLRGRNLCCWCPLTDAEGNPFPCHADVLLEMVNAGS